LGTTTAFYGGVIADASVTLNTGATINCGRAIALTAAVTMDTNRSTPGTASPLQQRLSPQPCLLSALAPSPRVRRRGTPALPVWDWQERSRRFAGKSGSNRTIDYGTTSKRISKANGAVKSAPFLITNY
jgi:Ice-binding-like